MRRRTTTSEVLETKPAEPKNERTEAELKNVVGAFADPESRGMAMLTDEVTKPRRRVTQEMKVTSEKLGKPIEEDFTTAEPDATAHKFNRTLQGAAPNKEPITGGRNFASIVSFVFSINVNDDFDRIKGKLQLDRLPSQTDYGTLADSLDLASENARLSLQVLVVAKSILDDLTTTKETLDAPLYEAAKQKLQEQKASGASSKQITNGDVESMAIRMFPDELVTRASEHSKAKRTVEYLDGLVTCWGERVKTLRQMVANARNV